jgi:hypothetical protein
MTRSIVKPTVDVLQLAPVPFLLILPILAVELPRLLFSSWNHLLLKVDWLVLSIPSFQLLPPFSLGVFELLLIVRGFEGVSIF